MSYWSLHTHTRHSIDDALSPVPQLVARAHELGHPAFGMTDHGSMAGVHAGYLACRELGMPFAPGCEMYITPLHETKERASWHLTMAAYTGEGYRNLVALHNQAHRQFYRRPRLDFADFAAAAEAGRTAGIAVATGCRSGPVVKALVDRGPEAAQQVIEALECWFPHVYVELMDHDFKAEGMWDAEIVTELVAIAERMGVPTILTGDAHYALREERELHDALKVLVTFVVDPEDGKFRGEGYWLPSDAEMRELHPWGWEGLADLASRLKVKIPELDTFSAKIPDVTFGKDQMYELKMAVIRRHNEIETWTSKAAMDRIKARTRDEFEVIDFTGMAGYLLLVKMICDFMDREGIWYYARGSVAGSRVCYDLGISNTDPIYWNIRMDRFLSGDRESLPDIDLDIEHERRGEVIAMLEEAGYSLAQVGTRQHYGLDAEVDDETEEVGGSLRVKYYSTLHKQGIPSVPWNEVSRDDKRKLYALARNDRPPADRLISGIGAHPGGYVVAESDEVLGCLPIMMINSSGTAVTAYDKHEVEAMGFPKIDLLGSKVLTAIKQTSMSVTGKNTYEAKTFWRDIPFNDPAAIKRASSGNTVGLFQLSGWAQRQGLQDLKPRKTADIVAAQALFRPAPLNSGFTKEYLARRLGAHEVPQMHDDITAETKDTYGITLYQEQVVGLLRRIGLTPSELTKMLKAVKASGKADTETAKTIVADALGGIVIKAKERGWNDADVTYLERALLDYGAGYSFGKAHSVTYGVAAYVTAYLAAHHPLDFWTGMLNAYMGSKNSKGDSLEPMYWKAARSDEIRIKEPHVNQSEIGYVMDRERNAILKGLLSIRNVGRACAEELIAKRPFATVMDLGMRVNGKVSGAKMLLTAQTIHDAVTKMVDDPVTGHRVESDLDHAVANLYRAGALKELEFGEPIRRAKGRKRKCTECTPPVTFPTPLDYEDHLEAEHVQQGV